MNIDSLIVIDKKVLEDIINAIDKKDAASYKEYCALRTVLDNSKSLEDICEKIYDAGRDYEYESKFGQVPQKHLSKEDYLKTIKL